jgi:hypothetical protein
VGGHERPAAAGRSWLSRRKLVIGMEWTREVAGLRGSRFEEWSGADSGLLANASFLVGYWHPAAIDCGYWQPGDRRDHKARGTQE